MSSTPLVFHFFFFWRSFVRNSYFIFALGLYSGYERSIEPNSIMLDTAHYLSYIDIFYTIFRELGLFPSSGDILYTNSVFYFSLHERLGRLG
jgi:hypothetical protein